MPDDIPSYPGVTYKDEGWIGWGDWLGTGTIATRLRQYIPFNEAREFARGLGLKSQAEWKKFCKGELPEKGAVPDVSSHPQRTYKDKGWISWGDWLGTETIRSRLRLVKPHSSIALGK